MDFIKKVLEVNPVLIIPSSTISMMNGLSPCTGMKKDLAN